MLPASKDLPGRPMSGRGPPGVYSTFIQLEGAMRFLGIKLFFVSPSSAALATRFVWRESALPVCVHQRDASVDANNRREAPPIGSL